METGEQKAVSREGHKTPGKTVRYKGAKSLVVRLRIHPMQHIKETGMNTLIATAIMLALATGPIAAQAQTATAGAFMEASARTSDDRADVKHTLSDKWKKGSKQIASGTRQLSKSTKALAKAQKQMDKAASEQAKQEKARINAEQDIADGQRLKLEAEAEFRIAFPGTPF